MTLRFELRVDGPGPGEFDLDAEALPGSGVMGLEDCGVRAGGGGAVMITGAEGDGFVVSGVSFPETAEASGGFNLQGPVSVVALVGEVADA